MWLKHPVVKGWKINREEVEEVKVFKLVFRCVVDRCIREAMCSWRKWRKAEECAGKVEWMSRKDEQFEVKRGRLLGELLAYKIQQRSSGQVVIKTTNEAVQEKIGRKLLKEGLFPFCQLPTLSIRKKTFMGLLVPA